MVHGTYQAVDYLAEAYMISYFNVATRSSTNAAGINLPPIHGAQKGIDPTLKPESQSKSQQTLVKPTLATPNKRLSKPVVRWTPSQTPATTKFRTPSLGTKATPRNLQNTPMQVQTPAMIRVPLSTQTTPSSACKQTPVRDQLITKTPIRSAQVASRKLVQKSMKLLNTPISKPSTSVPLPVRLFPASAQHDHADTRSDVGIRSHADKSLHADRNLDTDKHVDVDKSTISHLKAPLHLYQNYPLSKICCLTKTLLIFSQN